MTLQTPARTGHQMASSPVTERQARSARGVTVLVAGVAATLAGVALLVYAGQQTGGAKTALVWVGIIVVIITGFVLAGLTPVVPGPARVIPLFGKSRDTIRDPALQWGNPF